MALALETSSPFLRTQGDPGRLASLPPPTSTVESGEARVVSGEWVSWLAERMELWSGGAGRLTGRAAAIT